MEDRESLAGGSATRLANVRSCLVTKQCLESHEFFVLISSERIV